jgi:hypothetical protein
MGMPPLPIPTGIANMRKLLIQKELENGNEIKHLVPIFFQEIKKT